MYKLSLPDVITANHQAWIHLTLFFAVFTVPIKIICHLLPFWSVYCATEPISRH